MRATEKLVGGQTFVESMPEVREIVDAILDVDEGLKSERMLSMDKTFDMRKGEAVNYLLPASLFGEGNDLFVGLGWECHISLLVVFCVRMATSQVSNHSQHPSRWMNMLTLNF